MENINDDYSIEMEIEQINIQDLKQFAVVPEQLITQLKKLNINKIKDIFDYMEKNETAQSLSNDLKAIEKWAYANDNQNIIDGVDLITHVINLLMTIETAQRLVWHTFICTQCENDRQEISSIDKQVH